MNIIPPFSAIPSWDGYEYQGHIALYHALTKLTEAIKNDSVSQWDLEIEGKEDFSIIHNGSYESFHQVKRGGVSLGANDKFSFIVGVIQDSAEIGYFHINKNEVIKNDFVSSTLTYIDELLKELQKEIKGKDQLSEGEDENDYIVMGKINANAKKASAYDLLFHKCGKNAGKVEVEKGVAELTSELKDCKKLIEEEQKKYQGKNPGISADARWVSVYPTRWNSTDEVSLACCPIIKEIIMKKEPSWTFVNDDYCRFICTMLYKELLSKISFCNDNRNTILNCRLAFSEIYERIICDYYKKAETTDFLYYVFIDSLKKRYDSFASFYCNKNDCISCPNNATCNVYKQMNKFSEMNNDSQCKIAFNLLLENPKSSHNLPSDSLIEKMFLDEIKEIDKLEISSNNVIMAEKNGEGYYWLSLDDSWNKYALQNKLERGLNESGDESFGFECKVLITENLNDDFFFLEGSKVTVLEEEQLREMNTLYGHEVDINNNNVNKTNIIRLVNANKAKDELR